MDCCNYMQYRHHQPYYGSQYYESLPPYHGEFYGQQMYPEYYGNSPYYPQQWPCAASFPDYVYNPKEARIRKAMRDATRERSIGASPMLSRPSARRASHNWVSPHEELMMSPLASMRAAIEPQVCGGFPLPSGANQFMSVMNGYNKLEAAMPPSNPAAVHTGYMQSNPLAQLQQHTEMWTDYHQPMRPRSSGNPFMMPEVSSYQQNTAELAGALMMEKPSHHMSPVAAPSATPPMNENVPPDGDVVVEKSAHADVGNFDNSMEGAPNISASMDSGQDHFMPVFEHHHHQADAFEQIDDTNNIKKSAVSQIRTNNNNNKCTSNTNNTTNNNNKSASKPLPDFNEAFGSTERGRFQSPPDPRLAPSKGYLDYFYDSNPIKFDDYQI